MHRRRAATMLCVAMGLQLVSCRHLPTATRAQAGVLHGSVVDPNHVPVAARITAIPGDGRSPRPPVNSTGSGEFTLALNLGFYTIHVAAEGFVEIWQTVVLRQPGEALTREFVLERDTSPARPQLQRKR